MTTAQAITQSPALAPVGVRPASRPLGEILIEMRAVAAEVAVPLLMFVAGWRMVSQR